MVIQFSFQTKYGMFTDAIHLPDDHTYTDDELEILKVQRRDNWISHIDNSQVEIIEPTFDPTSDITVAETTIATVEESNG